MRDKLDAILRMEIEEAKRYGIAGVTIREETQKANARYSDKNDTEIVETLKQMDTLWVAAKADDMWAKQYLENTLARRLKLYQQSHSREYVEIMVTDRKGALIGGTRKTSHYYQGEEAWWINAFHENLGDIYVSNIHLDESSDIYVLDISAPIMDDSQHGAIGVIKVTLDAAEVFETILDLKIAESGHAHLVDSSGKILIEGAKDNTVCAFITGEIPPHLAKKMITPLPSWYIGMCEHCGDQVVSASALLPITSEIGPNSFGGEKWYLLIHEGKSVAFSILYQLITILILGILIATTVIVFVSVKLANRIVHPIHLLHKGAEIIGDGHLDHRLNIKTGDEIEQLANGFNRMSDKLQDSYQFLEKRVKERTAELQQAQQLLEMILDKTGTGLDIIDSGYNIRYINESWKKIYGDPTGRKCYQYFMGNDAPCVECGITQSIKTGLPVVTEEYLPKEERHVQVITVPCKDENNETVFAEVNVDITERKRVEADLCAAKAEVDQIFQTAADGMRVVDRDFNIVRLNDTFATMVGIPREGIIGKKCYDIFTSVHCRTSNCSLNQVLSGQEGVEYECLRRRPDGKKIPCIVVATPFKGPNGTVIGIVEDFRDISERQHLEAQIRQAQKMESIGTMAGGIAHDFNNILGGILGYISVIKMHIQSTDPIYRYVELIEKAGNRAANLISQLLAFSRKGKYEIKPININNSIQGVLSILEGTIKKNVEISSALAKEIPLVEGDAAQIEQTIMNICVNAVDAMSDGGKLHLTTGLIYLDEAFGTTHPGAKPGHYVHITVTDTGAGMDKEILPKIFEPFFTTKDKDKGTGLGLSMVYGIVKNHGGYVDVHSEPDKGSIFHIYLPPLPGAKTRKGIEMPPQEEIVTGQETILIVDDEEIIRTMLKEVLETLGYTVLMASKGEEAIKIYREHCGEIDVVIIDMIMPKMGGKETYLKLKKINPDIRAILASGYSQDAAIQEILRSGIHGFIHKPFTTTELSLKIREILSC
jgi:PAS domain S-box-containing protein